MNTRVSIRVPKVRNFFLHLHSNSIVKFFPTPAPLHGGGVEFRYSSVNEY